MKKIMENMASTLITWMKNEILARRSQWSGTSGCLTTEVREALKKETVAIMEEIKARITKKCPNCPANKCSPSNFIIVV